MDIVGTVVTGAAIGRLILGAWVGTGTEWIIRKDTVWTEPIVPFALLPE